MLIEPADKNAICFFLLLESELDADLVGLASLGFTGCLSGVRFNSITPVKAALLHPDSLVSITGPLAQSSCGSSSPVSPTAEETINSLSGEEQPLTCIIFLPTTNLCVQFLVRAVH